MLRDVPKTIRRPGFTLIELLIASLITGMVLTMAMTGFSQAKRAADLTRSKSVGANEAAQGVKEVAALLRKASIIYYTGVPLFGAPVSPTGNGTNGNFAPVPTSMPFPGGARIQVPGKAPPATMYTLASAGAGGPTIHFDPLNPAGTAAGVEGKFSSIATTVFRNSFRFQAPAAAGSSFRVSDSLAVAGKRLTSNAGEAPTAVANAFTAPLVYMAEAIMPPVPIGVVPQPGEVAPMGWNFYVLYLAPMDIAPVGTAPTDQDSNPLLPTPGITSKAAIRDRGGPSGAGSWRRSIVPFELRLLTVRNIPSITSANIATGIAGNRQRFKNPVGGAAQDVLPVPWDIAPGETVYDPVALTNTTLAGGLLTGGYAPYSLPPPKGASVGTCDQTRVLGTGPHSNYDSPANDPPQDAVFAGFAAAANCSDRVIARWIDPDNANGTFVRFQNPNTTTGAGNPFNAANPALDGNNRLIDAYEGGFQYSGVTPTRAVVSITTRFRTSRDIPFQFDTQSEEVELDSSNSFTQGTQLRLRRY